MLCVYLNIICMGNTAWIKMHGINHTHNIYSHMHIYTPILILQMRMYFSYVHDADYEQFCNDCPCAICQNVILEDYGCLCKWKAASCGE